MCAKARDFSTREAPKKGSPPTDYSKTDPIFLWCYGTGQIACARLLSARTPARMPLCNAAIRSIGVGIFLFFLRRKKRVRGARRMSGECSEVRGQSAQSHRAAFFNPRVSPLYAALASAFGFGIHNFYVQQNATLILNETQKFC